MNTNIEFCDCGLPYDIWVEYNQSIETLFKKRKGKCLETKFVLFQAQIDLHRVCLDCQTISSD